MNYNNTYKKYLVKLIYPNLKFSKVVVKKKLYKYFIIIPIYNEYKYIFKTLESLNNQNQIYLSNTLIILLINNSKNCSRDIVDNNYQTEQLILSKQYNFEYALLDYYSQQNALISKEFRIGTIRKIGMDFTLQYAKPDSLLFCLDADSVVSINYLENIIKYYKKSHFNVATVTFKHQKSDDTDIEYAIKTYEDQLYNMAKKIKQSNSPYGYVSMGSTIVCTVSAYIAVGGMPQKTAAEDFYFLQALAKFTNIYQIQDCLVYPSSRAEQRVYLGTGYRMIEYKQNKNFKNLFFPDEAYEILKKFISFVNNNYTNSYENFNQELNKTFNNKVCNFLYNHNIGKIWDRINKNSKSKEQFMLFFHQWFDALKIIQFFKYLK